PRHGRGRDAAGNAMDGEGRRGGRDQAARVVSRLPASRGAWAPSPDRIVRKTTERRARMRLPGLLWTSRRPSPCPFHRFPAGRPRSPDLARGCTRGFEILSQGRRTLLQASAQSVRTIIPASLAAPEQGTAITRQEDVVYGRKCGTTLTMDVLTPFDPSQ